MNKKELSNGARLTLFDASRKITGDRWLVKLRCEVAVSLSEDFSKRYPDDTESVASFLHETKNILSHCTIMERHFIAEDEKENVLGELVSNIYMTKMGYFESPVFPQKLFDKLFKEFITRKQDTSSLLRDSTEEIQDDDGPADFSFCFKD